ncbi:hypothetical protein BBAL3_302 [Brevundimonas sp. BAL3]|uniref:DUF7697 family protein n=1 Tax=Brevundimonas sp. BAL3 TaxID=391600 RepID=UPI00017EB723|nr:hypothetical protein [Brevundimonas sp. BAL3]EDX79145.1 hypothetical protein BBAL3_302 [Brevundimonas sp. BAL3]
MIKSCQGQVRAIPTGVIGLDYTAVILTAQMTGAAGPLLASVLAPVESLLVAAMRPAEA